jgi:hypothetical protein
MLDFMPIQNGDGFSGAAEKMIMDTQAIVENVRYKLLKANAKYKEVDDKILSAKVFKKDNDIPTEREIYGGVV